MVVDLVCALLAALVAQHAYGGPTAREDLLRISSYEAHRGGEAKAAYDTLRDAPFVVVHHGRGIRLDHSRFGEVAQFLHDECGWSEFELRVRLKHFEGWEHLDLD